MKHIVVALFVIFICCENIMCENLEEYLLSNETELVMLLQVIRLVHIDIFECTKPGIQKYNRREKNSIARYFTDRNEYSLMFFLAALGNVSIIPLCDFVFDREISNIIKHTFLISVMSGEMMAINTWRKSSPAKSNVFFSFYKKF